MFGFLMLCLLLHVAFKPLNIIKDKDLSGYYSVPANIEWNLEDYFSGKYQDSSEKYINYKYGLFPGFTRIHHQIEYSFFNRIHVKDVHIGQNGYLYRYCVGCITTRTFDSLNLEKYLNKYLVIQDSLKACGKNMVWLIAPDKNIVFSEYLPLALKHDAEVYSYYWTLQKAFKRKGIEFIDFNELAFREKNKYPYEVFNKGGVHWTNAYATRCFDSLSVYLSLKTNIKIKNTISLKKVENPWGPDIDMEEAANLLLPLQQDKLFLADMISESNSKSKKLLLIGDSFAHSWTWTKYFTNCFHPKSEFWYYNREVNSLENTFIRNVDHKNTRKTSSEFDTFIIIFNAANAEYLDYGFVDDMYK